MSALGVRRDKGGAFQWVSKSDLGPASELGRFIPQQRTCSDSTGKSEKCHIKPGSRHLVIT
jgi:hypothetical protein